MPELKLDLEKVRAYLLKVLARNGDKAETLEKATRITYAIGTVRTWKGKKFRKVGPNKWREIFEGDKKGKNIAIGRVEAGIKKATTMDQILDLVRESKDRFRTKDGKIDPVVLKILAQAKSRRGEVVPETRIGTGKADTKAKAEFSTRLFDIGKELAALKRVPEGKDKDKRMADLSQTITKVKDDFKSSGGDAEGFATLWDKAKKKSRIEYEKTRTKRAYGKKEGAGAKSEKEEGKAGSKPEIDFEYKPFVEIARAGNYDGKATFKTALSVKGIPAHVSEKFFTAFGDDGKRTEAQAWAAFVEQVKAVDAKREGDKAKRKEGDKPKSVEPDRSESHKQAVVAMFEGLNRDDSVKITRIDGSVKEGKFQWIDKKDHGDGSRVIALIEGDGRQLRLDVAFVTGVEKAEKKEGKDKNDLTEELAKERDGIQGKESGGDKATDPSHQLDTLYGKGLAVGTIRTWGGERWIKNGDGTWSRVKAGKEKGVEEAEPDLPKGFSLDVDKMKANPIPPELKKKWMASGGVDNPEYKAWIEKNWKSDKSEAWNKTRAEAGVGEQPKDTPVPKYKFLEKKAKEHPESLTEDDKKTLQNQKEAKKAHTKYMKEHARHVEASNAHLAAVEAAVKAGKPVPDKVLNEYPHLKELKDKIEAEAESKAKPEDKKVGDLNLEVRTIAMEQDKVMKEMKKVGDTLPSKERTDALAKLQDKWDELDKKGKTKTKELMDAEDAAKAANTIESPKPVPEPDQIQKILDKKINVPDEKIEPIKSPKAIQKAIAEASPETRNEVQVQLFGFDPEAESGLPKTYTFKPGRVTKNIPFEGDKEFDDYTKAEPLQMALSNAKTVLDKPKPSYIPELDESYFAYNRHKVIAGKFGDNEYLMYTSRSEAVVVSLDVLAATQHYYLTKAKAKFVKEVKEKNEKRVKDAEAELANAEAKLAQFKTDNPGASTRIYDNHVSYYKAILSGENKVSTAKGSPRMLPDNKMLRLQAEVFRKFGGDNANNFARDQKKKDPWALQRELNEDLKQKLSDMQMQYEDLLNAHAKGEETSYGKVGRKDTIRDSHGVYVKRQNGKEISEAETKQIAESLDSVFGVFGDRSDMAKSYGLTISHSGDVLMHARKAMGIFFPSYHAIGVSEVMGKSGFGFTLAHEYAHFMDCYLGEKQGHHFASDNYSSDTSAIANTFRKSMKDKQSSDYQNRTCECFARALEQYFSHKSGQSDAYQVQYNREGNHPEPKVFEERIVPLIENWFKSNDKLLKSMRVPLVWRLRRS
jgi:hypothetical protein